MKKLIVSLLLVSCYGLGFTVRAQEKSSETFIEEGVSLYDEGKYQEAIDSYKQVNENDSNYVWMLSELCMTFLQTQNYDSAIYYADKGLQFPSSLRQHLMRSKGTAYDAAGQHDKCIEVYTEATRLYPYSYLLHYNLGMTYLGLNDYPAAMQCFQESIRCNPFHASSHMRLGMLMARQENYTRAMLSLETFLALEPRSDRSNTILIYLENLSSGYIDTTYGEIISPLTDNAIFEELDGLIRAKIVLNDRYKPVIKFNANVVKQTSLLMEMLPFDGIDNDFWTETYLPLFRAIKEGDYLEPFLYTILSSSGKEDVLKWMNKNKKTMDAFYKTGANLTNIRNSRKVVIDGREMTLAATYDDDGNLMSLGNRDASGKETGIWRYFYPNGELKSGGEGIGGERTGKWFFNNDNGLTETVETYRNGVLNGDYVSYHPTGKVNVTGTFVNGAVDGKATWHNSYGVIVRTMSYKNDVLDGEARTYYNSGQTMEVFNYQKNELTGKKVTYYPDGHEFMLASYKSDKPDGEYVEYYPNGRVSVKGTYKEGKEEGEWTYYFSNGKPRIVQNFTAGIITGLYRTWYYNGKPETEAHFSGSGKQDGLTTHYDHRGRKVLEEEYIDGLLVKMITDFTNPDGPVAFLSPDGTFSYRVYSGDGKLRLEGSYDKGVQTGEMKFYYNNGNIRQKALFKEGSYDGEVVTYHPNGKTESLSYYKDGLLEGKYTEYGLDGTIVKTGSYLHNNMNNYWRFYTADGSIETLAFYLNGLLNGWYTTYAVDGKIKSRDRFLSGNLIREYQYDPEGNIINDVNIVETEKYQIKSTKDIVLADCSMKGGLHIPTDD